MDTSVVLFQVSLVDRRHAERKTSPKDLRIAPFPSAKPEKERGLTM